VPQPTHKLLRIAVVGGGWAGLAAAVALAERGVPVTVFEAARQLGGRARRVTLEGRELDNGQHILIGAYRTTFGLMRKVNANPDALMLRMPLELRYADGFALRAPRFFYPFNLLCGLLGASGLAFGDACRAGRFLARLRAQDFRVVPDRAVSRWLAEHGQQGVLRSHLWEPLCVSALNTPAEHASAQVFANVLRDGLAGVRENSDLVIPRVDLGQLFPEPAARYLRDRGSSVELGAAVRRLSRHAGGFRVDERPELFDRVILATGPQHAAALLQSFPALSDVRATLGRFTYEPITTCYLQYQSRVRLPSPMIGIADGFIQWVFDRGRLGGPAGLIAAVISGSGPHAALPKEALGLRLHSELARFFPALGAPHWTRVIAERRATFSCRPALERPPAQTPENGLLLCGDYLDPAYPGTLEAAVQSGLRAAAALSTAAV
jgi:hydroxysqualene dehydroxylase